VGNLPGCHAFDNLKDRLILIFRSDSSSLTAPFPLFAQNQVLNGSQQFMRRQFLINDLSFKTVDQGVNDSIVKLFVTILSHDIAEASPTQNHCGVWC
jgi:hypothetical protein